jgi:23S rRNA pseudouridine2605 synthase
MSGAVTVNDKIPESPGIKINPDIDIIKVNGKSVSYNIEEKIYILLNKLPGYISASSSPSGEPTIMELLPDTGKRLFPVGRLDKDTEGLIIVTNDGELTYRLTHPKHHVDKVYLVWIDGKPSNELLDKLRNGIELDDGITAPAIIEIENNQTIQSNKDITCLRITIHEGRKRQIKRMINAIGYSVLRLKRIQIGSIVLGDLKPGKYRYLTQQEVNKLSRL